MLDTDNTAVLPLAPSAAPLRTSWPHGSALILISCFSWAGVFVALIYVARKVKKVFVAFDAELPSLTRLLFQASDLLGQWWYVAAPLAGLVLGGSLALSLVWRSKANRAIGLVLLLAAAAALALVAVGILLPLKTMMEGAAVQ